MAATPRWCARALRQLPIGSAACNFSGRAHTHSAAAAAAAGAAAAAACQWLPATAQALLLCSSAPGWQLVSGAASLWQRQQALLCPQHGFAAHYAKGRGGGSRKLGKHKPAPDTDDDEAAGEQEQPEFDLQPVERLMQQAVQHLEQELAGVRTGRANPGLLENLLVDAHGDHVPIKACGSVTVRSPQLLAVVLYDASLAKAVEKAIRESPLSLNPSTEGSEVLVTLPRLTQETIDRFIKLVHLEAEGAHQSIRRARQKGMDAVKKAFKAASADEKKRQEKEVQRLHDQYVAEVERLKKHKDSELREHKD